MTEKRYPIIEKEGLAIVYACERFRNYLIGKQFTIVTDHLPLISLYSQKFIDELTPRLQRFRLRLLRFDFNIVHIPGKSNFVADMLSRTPVEQASSIHCDFISEVSSYSDLFIDNISLPNISVENIKTQLKNDAICSNVIHYVTSSWPKPRLISSDLQPYFSVRNECKWTEI